MNNRSACRGGDSRPAANAPGKDPTLRRAPDAGGPQMMQGSGRRAFLKGAAGAGSLILGGLTFARAQPLKVVVVGGGIVGASIALHLAEAGAKVTLLERQGPAMGATQNSFAWVNAFVADKTYRDLRLKSLLAYRQLDRRLGLNMVWGGYLNWAGTAADLHTVRETARELADTHYPVRAVSPQDFGVLDPHVVPGEILEAVYSSIDGHLDPVFVTRRFLEQANHAGADIVYPCELLSLELSNNRLRGVITSRGRYEADRLVVAAGVGSPSILALTGFQLPLKHAPGILAHSTPGVSLTRVIHDAPRGLSFKQMADGSVVGTDSPDPPDIPAHHEIRERVMSFPNDELVQYHGNRILTKIAAYLPEAKDLTLERLTLGFRPVPLDEFPVMGPVPGSPDIHVAVTHSGVSLAPIVGRYTAREVLTGRPERDFSPYRPQRFASPG